MQPNYRQGVKSIIFVFKILKIKLPIIFWSHGLIGIDPTGFRPIAIAVSHLPYVGGPDKCHTQCFTLSFLWMTRREMS